MDEYISREKAIELIQPRVKPSTVYGEGYLQAIEHASDILALMPAADARPVKKCRMIPQNPDCRGYTDGFICTNCQSYIDLGFMSKNYEGNFCLECGAEVEDGDPDV